MSGIVSQSPTMTSAPVNRHELALLRRWKEQWLPALLLIAITFAAYLPVWRAGYIWDDDILLTNNPAVKAADGLRTIWLSTRLPDYFPVTSTAFWLQWRLWGASPLGYHLVNVLLHALSAVLWWRVLRRLAIPAAWMAAAIFALHPVNVESVAWISELKNTLALVFYGLALLAYMKFDDDGRRRWYAAALMAFILSLLSKTAAAAFPVLVLGFAWWRRGRIARRDVVRSLPFFAAAAALGLLTIWFQYERAIGSTVVRTDGFWSRLAGAGWAVWFYLYKALVPTSVMIVYPRWHIDAARALTYVPVLLIALGLLACWRYRERWGRGWFFAATYFIAMLLPTLGFFNVGAMRYSLVADRWQYFAIIVPIALATVGVARVLKRARRAQPIIAPALGVMVLFVLGVATWRQSRIYRDPSTLWPATLARNPNCAIGQNEVGNDLLAKGRIDEAIDRFRKALEVLPNYEVAHYNLGCALLEKGQVEEAIGCFRTAVRIEPDLFNAQYNLGTTLLEHGQVGEAIVHLRKAVELEPASAKAHQNLATALGRAHQLEAAVRQYEMALTIEPRHVRARHGLGGALLQLGRIDDAIAELQKAVEIQPDDAAIHNNLGEALMRRGQVADALLHFQKALDLQPKYTDAQVNLSQALMRSGQLARAIDQLRALVVTTPADADVHNNLANALLQQEQLDAARREYEEALALQPKHAKAHNNLGLILCHTGHFDEAIAHFRQALTADPSYANAHRNLGDALVERGDVEQAIPQFQAALAIEPADVSAHLALGGALLRQGKTGAAITAYEAALRFEPNNPDALCKLAWVLATSRDAAARDGRRAVGLARQADAVVGGKNAVVLRVLAAASAESGQLPEAISLAERGLQLAADGNPELKQALQSDLKLYQAGSPCRD